MKRSETYQKIYPDELMLKAFGTLTPDVSRRLTYFFDMWMERRKYRCFVDNTKIKLAINVLKQIGLKDPWDYQFKGPEIRFSYAEDLAQFKIMWGDN